MIYVIIHIYVFLYHLDYVPLCRLWKRCQTALYNVLRHLIRYILMTHVTSPSWFCHSVTCDILSLIQNAAPHNLSSPLKNSHLWHLVCHLRNVLNMWHLILWHYRHKIFTCDIVIIRFTYRTPHHMTFQETLVLLQSPNTAVIPECQFLFHENDSQILWIGTFQIHIIHNFHPIISPQASNTDEWNIHLIPEFWDCLYKQWLQAYFLQKSQKLLLQTDLHKYLEYMLDGLGKLETGIIWTPDTTRMVHIRCKYDSRLAACMEVSYTEIGENM